jgi:hypothetical protein
MALKQTVVSTSQLTLNDYKVTISAYIVFDIKQKHRWAAGDVSFPCLCCPGFTTKMDADQEKGSAECHKHVNKKSIARQL